MYITDKENKDYKLAFAYSSAEHITDSDNGCGQK